MAAPARQGTSIPDVEWIAVKHGVKPAMRVTISPERADEFEKRLSKEGFAHVRSEKPALLPGRDSQSVIYAALTEGAALALRDAEAPVLPGYSHFEVGDAMFDAHRHLGRSLGYPPCCVDAFVDRLSRGVTNRIGGGEANEDFVAAEDALSRTTKLHGRLNNLLFDRQVRLVSFYPCRYDCDVAMAYADGVFSALEKTAPLGAAKLRAEIAVVVQLSKDGQRNVGGAAFPPPGLTLDFTAF